MAEEQVEVRTTPEHKILINDVEIPPELKADVLDIKVCHYIEGPDTFDIAVNMLNSHEPELKWVDHDYFTPGNKIEIKLGYVDEYESIFSGEITALHPRYFSDDAPRMSVQGYDRLHRFRRGKKTRSFLQMKDSQIAEQVASEVGLTPEVEDTEIVHNYVVQNNLSDIDFLLERARRIRYEVIVEDRTLKFRKAANHLGNTVALEYMRDLKHFFPRLSTLRQVSEVKVRGWNPASKEAILGVARAGDETTRMEGSDTGSAIAESAFGKTTASIVNIPVDSQAEAEQIAKAKFNDMNIELICGDGEAVGNTAIRAGATIKIIGLGDRFSGLYYIKSSEHVLGPQVGYITKFNAVRNAS
jgi:phage protein D